MYHFPPILSSHQFICLTQTPFISSWWITFSLELFVCLGFFFFLSLSSFKWTRKCCLALDCTPCNKRLSVRETAILPYPPSRQANRRRSQIRIMRDTVAWTDWNDTHTCVWFHARMPGHTRTDAYTLLLVTAFHCSAYLFVCLSVFASAYSSALSCCGFPVSTGESHFSLTHSFVHTEYPALWHASSFIMHAVPHLHAPLCQLLSSLHYVPRNNDVNN